MGETKDLDYEEELLDYKEEEEKAPDSVTAKANGEAGKRIFTIYVGFCHIGVRSAKDRIQQQLIHKQKHLLKIQRCQIYQLSTPKLTSSKGPFDCIMATLRNLKIKTSSCKRLLKELSSYEKEVEREVAKTADMKEKSADPYDLKQQENVLAESRMMVPDCRKRLESAFDDLRGTLVELEESGEKEGPEFDDARSLIYSP